MPRSMKGSSIRAALERAISPGLGTCYRCRRPWKFPATRRTGARSYRQLNRDRFLGLVGVESHATRYTTDRSCFPLCEGCWSSLTPEERLPYYDQLWLNWIGDALRGGFVEEYGEDKYEQIREAVLAGL